MVNGQALSVPTASRSPPLICGAWVLPPLLIVPHSTTLPSLFPINPPASYRRRQGPPQGSHKVLAHILFPAEPSFLGNLTLGLERGQCALPVAKRKEPPCCYAAVARATRTARISSDSSDWIMVSTLARLLKTAVSVGPKVMLVLKARKR